MQNNHIQTPINDPARSWIVPVLLILFLVVASLVALFGFQVVRDAQAASAIPTWKIRGSRSTASRLTAQGAIFYRPWR
jgi:cell division septal protein FtsQ